ncbi:MAG: GntR family transcriptional regulator [Rhodospirillaceae bacterium]
MPSMTMTQDGTPYQRLKQMILAGGLAPGEALVERTLASRLLVSRTPVRAAIMRLEKEGLVRVVEGKGAFVAACSVEDMIEIYQMREGLEPIAARLSCAHIEAKQLERFEQALTRCRDRLPEIEDDPDAWRALGRDFHDCFIRASQNRRIIAALDAIHDQIELFRGLGRSVNSPRLTVSAVDEHLQILDALKARDAARAEKAVRTHIQNGLKARLSLFHVPG